MFPRSVCVVGVGCDVSVVVSAFESLGCSVVVFDGEVDFGVCFDCDLLVVVSCESLSVLSEFFGRFRLGVLIGRRLAGGRRVLCVGNAGTMLFSGEFECDSFGGVDGDLSVCGDGDRSVASGVCGLGLLGEWDARVSGEVYSGVVDVCLVDEGVRALGVNDSVCLRNQCLVFEHPAAGLDCVHTVAPVVAWGRVEGCVLDVVLSVENAPLFAFLFLPVSVADFSGVLSSLRW